jgi:hypothetical protein
MKSLGAWTLIGSRLMHGSVPHHLVKLNSSRRLVFHTCTIRRSDWRESIDALDAWPSIAEDPCWTYLLTRRTDLPRVALAPIVLKQAVFANREDGGAEH